MTQPAKAQEPTMEEILASIRRIIADDDTTKAPPKAAEPLPPPQVVQRATELPAAPPVVPAAALPSAPPDPPARQSDIDAMLSSLNTTPARPPVEAPPVSDVFELTESMATTPEPASSNFRTIDGQSDVFFEERAAEMEPAPQFAADRGRSALEPDALISAATTAAVDSAFNTLAHTVLVQNARTLEDLVREMLRPLLKTWLDDNLPGLVERLVRAEIERVSRGRG
jgi:cell pole-organizing protein PopZ